MAKKPRNARESRLAALCVRAADPLGALFGMLKARAA